MPKPQAQPCSRFPHGYQLLWLHKSLEFARESDLWTPSLRKARWALPLRGCAMTSCAIARKADDDSNPALDCLTCLSDPSGCCKSTLLSMVADFSPANARAGSRGRCRGQFIVGRSRHRFKITRYFPGALRVRFKDTPPPKKNCREMGPAAHADKLPRQLLGGMKQRVAIARASAIDLRCFCGRALGCSGCADTRKVAGGNASDRLLELTSSSIGQPTMRQNVPLALSHRSSRLRCAMPTAAFSNVARNRASLSARARLALTCSVIISLNRTTPPIRPSAVRQSLPTIGPIRCRRLGGVPTLLVRPFFCPIAPGN
jgi:hypothetical protein